MHINPTFDDHRFASIADLSTFPDEEEVLFSIQTIFRVDNIESRSDGIHYVRLSLTDDDDPILRNLMEYVRRELNGRTPMHRLGQLLFNLEEWSKAKDIYESILNKTNVNDKNEMADLHHQLGVIADELKSSEEAMYHYQQVLNFDSNVSKTQRHRLAPTYASIGRLFHRTDHLNKALNYYKKAVRLALTAPIINQIEVGGYYNSIGNIFERKCCYEIALFVFKKALSNQLDGGLPLTHSDLAASFSNIENVYYNQKCYQKAFKYYQKCLDIELHSLPHDHSSLVDSYIIMGETFGCIEEAIKHIERAFEITKIQNLKKNYEQYIDELRSKLDKMIE